MEQPQYYTADEAAEQLSVSVSTIYSYVSRGLIRSEEADTSKRQRRYLAEDIDELKRRKQVRSKPETRAQGELHWGAAVVDSSITLISNGWFYYRGLDAIEFASQATLEQASKLLWTGETYGEPDPFFPAWSERDVIEMGAGLPAIERLQAALLNVAGRDKAAYDLRPESIQMTGGRILVTLTSAIIEERHPLIRSYNRTIADVLADKWTADPALLNKALVVCADHELNASAFTARCIASTGATPYQVVIGALASFSGHKHGGASDRVRALFREVGTPEQAYTVVSERLQRGEQLPGYGHPLYPDGDPRARLLIESIGSNRKTALVEAVNEAVWTLTNTAPNIDAALVALEFAAGLPVGAAKLMFALGRSAGWIAHAMEAYQGEIIRPRARYTGTMPDIPPLE